jgi:hypothetical protein
MVGKRALYRKAPRTEFEACRYRTGLTAVAWRFFRPIS